MPEPHLGLLVDHLSAVGVASDPASAAQGVHDQIEMRAPQYAHHMIPLYALLLVNAAAPAVATGGPDKPSAAVRPAPSQTLQRLEAEVDQLVVDARHVTGDEKNALNVHLQNVKTLRTEARAQVAELSSARVDALSANVSETATRLEFTVQGAGMVSHVSVYQS